jgi:hypothetical protein
VAIASDIDEPGHFGPGRQIWRSRYRDGWSGRLCHFPRQNTSPPTPRRWHRSAMLAPEAGVVAPLGLKAPNRNRGTRIGCPRQICIRRSGCQCRRARGSSSGNTRPSGVLEKPWLGIGADSTPATMVKPRVLRGAERKHA